MTNARRIPWAAVACAFAFFVLFQFFGNPVRGYIDTASLFYWWGYQWVNAASENQHGWVILGLSGWLAWRNLKQAESSALRAKSPEQVREQDAFALDSRLSALDSFLPASGALLCGLLLHALGFAAQQTRVCIVGFLLGLWGLFRLAGGRRWGDAAMFPIAFLVFAIPLNLLDSVGFWLRMWVVSASAAIAHVCGIGVLQNGTQLVAPDGRYNYDVAAACSGIRSLTAITALSLLAGYLNFQSWPRRLVLLVLCFPLVYLGNVARIVSIIFAAQLGGTKWGDVAHTVMGYGVFVIVLAGVLAGIALIRRAWPEETALRAEGQVREASGEGKETPEERSEIRNQRSGERRLLGAAGVVIALAIGEMFFLHHLTQLPRRGSAGVALAADGVNPIDLPGFIGTEWIGQRTEVTAIEREVLPADTGFSRRQYVNVAHREQAVFLSLVLSGKDRTSIHRPEICLVGQGWTIVETARHVFQFPGRAPVPATLLRVRREGQGSNATGAPGGKVIRPELVAYWFIDGEGVAATHWQRMWRDAWNRVVHGRADRWAYVLVQTTALDGEAAALARMQTVLTATLPRFQQGFAGEKP